MSEPDQPTYRPADGEQTTVPQTQSPQWSPPAAIDPNALTPKTKAKPVSILLLGASALVFIMALSVLIVVVTRGGDEPERATPISTGANHPVGSTSLDDDAEPSSATTLPSATEQVLPTLLVTTTASPATLPPTTEAPPPPVLTDADYAGLLADEIDSGRSAAGVLNGSWVVQLSSKQPGVDPTGQAWTHQSVWEDYQFRQMSNPTLLLWSGDWAYRSSDYYITVVNQRFSSADEALGWCYSNSMPADDCIAKRLHTGAPESGDTKYQAR